MDKKNTTIYPKAHFTPQTGWMNDPNGLVCHDGVYELYYQYNPYGVEWNHISWGHAKSTDLVNWENLPVTLTPDEDGYMFSGCGIRNDHGMLGLPKDTLLFFYTAAGHMSPESAGKGFKIMLAVSTDGGRTLEKTGKVLLDSPAWENRDPKVFWHEESSAYILVLYLHGQDFGIFRSENLEHFELTDRITLEGGYECPDLYLLPVEDSQEKKWVFWSADGSYYVGDFDGYHFKQTQERRYAYGTRHPLAYAAQTWSGASEDRVISVSWIKSVNVAGVYSGAYTMPRELGLVHGVFPVDEEKEPAEQYLLTSRLPREIEEKLEPVGNLEKAGEELAVKDGMYRFSMGIVKDFTMALEGESCEVLGISYDSDRGNLKFSYGISGGFEGIGRDARDLEILYDRGILEISANHHMLYKVADFTELRNRPVNKVTLTAGEVTVKVEVC